MRSGAVAVVLASLACPCVAAAHAVPDLRPESAIRDETPIDEPPSAAALVARDLDDYLVERGEEDATAIGRIPRGARVMRAALAQRFAPSLEELELERLRDPMLAVPLFLLDQLERGAQTPTDEHLRDRALPPPRSQEEENLASLAASLDPRHAREIVHAVEIEIALDARGTVSATRMIRSSGSDVLDRAAHRAASALVGRPVDRHLARHVVVVRFEVRELATRLSTIAGAGGDGAVVGRGIARSTVRLVRVSAPRRDPTPARTRLRRAVAERAGPAGDAQ